MSNPASPFWVSAFVDLPAETHDAGVQFWSAITGYRVSSPRGEGAQFVSLIPEDADDHLRIQRLGHGGPRVHLDLHVDNPAAAVAYAIELGATELGATERVATQTADLGYRVMRSPTGFTFCFVTHPAARLAPPSRWARDHHSLVDQVCLDIPADSYATEREFWVDLTGWTSEKGRFAEFEGLTPPDNIRVRLLLQRLSEPSGNARGHLDLSTDNREAEVERHRRLGAKIVGEYEHWVVLRDPAGMDYCITDRDPVSGQLPVIDHHTEGP